MVDALKNAPVRSIFCDDEDFLELIEMFVDGIEEKKAILRQSSAGEHTEELKVLAHQLKGASAGYGFEELSQIAAELELACKAEDESGIQQHKEIMLSHMDRILV
tara:strand:+ start:1851 stop:2165 length:315 start_codon:yes stop_codon:yes gene_type:complete